MEASGEERVTGQKSGAQGVTWSLRGPRDLQRWQRVQTVGNSSLELGGSQRLEEGIWQPLDQTAKEGGEEEKGEFQRQMPAKRSEREWARWR